jgi:CheY-like chemotaxis protein
MNGTKFVLVVEDDDEIRSLIVSSLKAESADVPLTVVEARDGREAIQFAGRQEFHCVVTDLNMPRTSGQELIRV